MYYVKMLDKALSGWGACAGKKSIFVVACETSAQAQAVAKAARKRSEMRSIKIQAKAPPPSDTAHVSLKAFADLSGNWLEFYHAT